MKRSIKLILILLFSTCFSAIAQVTFTIQELPSYTPSQDSIYIAGNFTGWEPGSQAFMLHKNLSGKWAITLAAQSSGTVIKYKFTRGSWETVEKGAGGEEISDRVYTFGSTDSVDVSIANWADAGGGSNSTAAANVKIISSDFFMPQLNRTRRIWVYYPPDYETSAKRYPVLYMHDGQNLFDAATSFSGEWEVDETLNTLAAQGKQVPLVVGIDNGGGNRIGEYTPWQNPQYGGGDGEKYMQFIVETLKPYIDANFRTLSDRENTGIMGSSLGGLISHFGSLKYQDIFSKAGLFSPSYWYSDSIWQYTHDTGKHGSMRFYQLCGTNESSAMESEMQQMSDSLIRIGFAQGDIFNKIVIVGGHNEKLWREAFSEAYLWLFNGYVYSVKDAGKVNAIDCFPNPVDDVLILNIDQSAVYDTVFIIDMKGQQVKSFSKLLGNKLDVHDLKPGTYLVKLVKGETVMEGKFVKW